MTNRINKPIDLIEIKMQNVFFDFIYKPFNSIQTKYHIIILYNKHHESSKVFFTVMDDSIFIPLKQFNFTGRTEAEENLKCFTM